MFQLDPIDVQDGVLIGATVIGLILISHQFNTWIDKQTDVDPLGSYSAVFTVLGVGYTLIGALLILTILFGWLPALFVTGILFFCFGVAGTPMILGDMRRGGRRRRNELRNIAQCSTRVEKYPYIEDITE